MGEKTYSIAVRLQKTVVYDAFVRVPVSDAVMADQLDEEGHRHLDGEKVMRAAERLGSDPATGWVQEGEATISPHPWQIPLPEGR